MQQPEASTQKREASKQENTCAICLNNMDTRGQAVFKAECSHSFHFQCIGSNVAHGNYVCPLCKAEWKELPFLLPQPNPNPNPRFAVSPTQQAWLDALNIDSADRNPNPNPATTGSNPRLGARWQTAAQRRDAFHEQFSPAPFFAELEPRVFNDDDPVDPPQEMPQGEETRAVPTAQQVTGMVEMKTFTEYPAVAKSASKDDFAVVIHLKAPGSVTEQLPESARAPVDLVTVLDVSGSMAGQKLTLLKQAMVFVIQNLGPADRLSIVSFSSNAKRLIKLTRMTDVGMNRALRAVDSLVAGGGTNITQGLSKGSQILEQRQHKNPVSSIILLSDGQDTFITPRSQLGRSRTNYDALLPQSVLRATARPIPIHTFGFGTDHDALAMHHIGQASGGTFSFIEDASAITEAFAQCIGGLLSVVAQEGRIGVIAGSRGVVVTKIKSGSYESSVESGGRKGWIDVGDLYADEQRSFLMFVNVPVAPAVGPMKLLKVKFSYKDAVTSTQITLDEQEITIDRPISARNNQICLEVEREMLRVQATEDMSAARAAADRGAMSVAVGILENRQRAVTTSLASRSGDSSISMLEEELGELRTRMSTRDGYERSGRAYALSGISAHSSQRATSRTSHSIAFGAGGGDGTVFDYQTPAMMSMRRKSQILKFDGGATTGGGGEGGSGSGAGTSFNQEVQPR
ncbi:hypothetical protein LUZ60_014986 [Juncus effusus]|nr:hypothetical protein LUZ60_014986 [Juncus effusus]